MDCSERAMKSQKGQKDDFKVFSKRNQNFFIELYSKPNNNNGDD